MAIITVSRGDMSGGMDFAQCLAQRLNYRCLSREVVVDAAEHLGVPQEMLFGKIEKSAGLWERLTASRQIYLMAVQSALADACVSGDLVYHGHAGHLLLKGVPTLLKVRLIAPMGMRVRALMARRGLAYGAARAYLRNVDQERVRWTKFLYDVDWGDPANYDLVINLADISMEVACSMVATIAQMPPYRSTETTRKRLADFALACRVKFALEQHAESPDISFDVSADGGEVEVLAELPGSCLLVKQGGPTEQKIRTIGEGVQGVESLRVTLRRFPERMQA